MKLNKIKEKLKETKEKRHKFNTICSMLYNFIWSIAKIIFGVFTFSYSFCISGASTLLFGFSKKIYLKNYKADDFETIKGKSITISILLIFIGILFSIYMARLFFISNNQSYGLILSITIALFSFVELGVAIYNISKAKKSNNLLLYVYRGCNLASSGFAIVHTQVALLAAQGTNGNLYNALTGTIFGLFSVAIGAYQLYYINNKISWHN